MMKRGMFTVIPALIAGLVIMTACHKVDTDELKAREMRLLDQYLIENNITQDPLPSGLYYIPLDEGTGESPVEGDWVEFEQGLECSWKIDKTIRKRYKFG